MKYLLILTLLLTLSQANKFKYREFKNVENFYSSITSDVIQLSIKHNTPPAVILAIAGLESGYGSGYVSKITGNILSLGANKNDIQLPALTIPYCKTDKNKKALFDPKEQKKCQELIWKKRPKSLKKDYRPKNIAGKTTNLEFFKYNPNQFKKAKLQSVDDFLTKWLRENHKYAPFRETKLWLENKVAKEGIDTLFTLETNLEFASKIGGRDNSFNYRDTWPKKVKYILKKTGLTELCSTIYYKKVPFNIAWKQH
ncbi:MAG: glucosaminidase domain-containing protein [Arcobacteraceae bacterium]|nr:glucosaminidase domain-containing protein [Arcobacteraceae bacterium]